MACAREDRYVVADLSHDDGGRRLADAEHRRQETDGASQGHQRLPDPRFDGDDRRVHRRDLREMELEHETKVRGDAAAERIDEFAPRRFQGR